MKICLFNSNYIDRYGDLKTNKSIIINNGIIESIKSGLSCVEATQKINVRNNIITPGFIDTHSHLGVVKKIKKSDFFLKNDISKNINFYEKIFHKAVKKGNLYSVILPGSRLVINGYGCVVNNFTNEIIKEKACFKVAIGEVPKVYYYNSKKLLGRPKQFKQLKNFLKKFKKRNIPFRCHVHKKSDIHEVINLFLKYKQKLVIDHATEAGTLLSLVERSKVMISFGPIFSRSVRETRNFDISLPSQIIKHKIFLGYQTDHNVYPATNLRNIVLEYIRLGALSPKDAFRCLTVYGAKIAGIDDKYGSINVGKKAEFLIWSKHPLLHRKSKIIKIFINNHLTSCF